jgi:hypothetical protein
MKQGSFGDMSIELDGVTFLNKNQANDIFQNIFSKYHKYMASEEGIVEPFNLAEAFTPPKAPKSITRIGRLIYHNPYNLNDQGNLFTLSDFFGSEYNLNPYTGATGKLRDWEIVDPLFFKYLHLLYKFRCAYFHGDLPPNNLNNNLAKAAFESLYEIFPAIIK